MNCAELRAACDVSPRAAPVDAALLPPAGVVRLGHGGGRLHLGGGDPAVPAGEPAESALAAGAAARHAAPALRQHAAPLPVRRCTVAAALGTRTARIARHCTLVVTVVVFTVARFALVLVVVMLLIVQLRESSASTQFTVVKCEGVRRGTTTDVYQQVNGDPHVTPGRSTMLPLGVSYILCLSSSRSSSSTYSNRAINYSDHQYLWMIVSFVTHVIRQ